MIAVADDDAEYQVAVRLGASLEARRLGCPIVGTEHLLMAAMSDPVVRWVLRGLGHDLRDVQGLVDQESRGRRGDDRAAGPLTVPARTLVAKTRADHTEFDPFGPADPRQFSAVLQSILRRLLTSDDECAARRILLELGITEHASAVLAVIEGNAGPSYLPRS